MFSLHLCVVHSGSYTPLPGGRPSARASFVSHLNMAGGGVVCLTLPFSCAASWRSGGTERSVEGQSRFLPQFLISQRVFCLGVLRSRLGQRGWCGDRFDLQLRCGVIDAFSIGGVLMGLLRPIPSRSAPRLLDSPMHCSMNVVDGRIFSTPLIERKSDCFETLLLTL